MKNQSLKWVMIFCLFVANLALGSESYPSSGFQAPSASSPPPASTRAIQTSTPASIRGGGISPSDGGRGSVSGAAARPGIVTPFQSQQSFSNSGEFFRSVGGESPQEDGWSSAIK